MLRLGGKIQPGDDSRVSRRRDRDVCPRPGARDQGARPSAPAEKPLGEGRVWGGPGRGRGASLEALA